MHRLLLLTTVAFLVSPTLSLANEGEGRASGATNVAANGATNDDVIRVLTQGDTTFVDATALGRAAELKFEVVQPNKLATFCSAGEQAICIPVQLDSANFQQADGRDYLAVSAIESALPVTITIDGDRASVSVEPGEDLAAADIGYNADWPPGRGFRPGETVPDIPLTVIDGREVRFSEFLGKRYILYCWASW